MRLNNIFQVSIHAILVNKTRTLLTSLGIIIGVASVILLVSIGTGIRQYVTTSFEDMGADLLLLMPGKISIGGGGSGREEAHNTGANNKLSQDKIDSLARALQADAKVASVMTNPAVAKYGSKTVDTSMIGVGSDYFTIRNMPLVDGRYFNASEVSRQSKVVIIGTTIIKKVFGSVSPIGQELLLNDKRYKVIGVLESKGSAMGNDQDNQVIVPITAIQQQLASDKVTYVYIKVNSQENVKNVTKKIETFFATRYKFKTDDFTVTSSEELLKTITGILNILTIGLGGIAAISLVVGGIGIMNIMLVSVTERTREIGLRKAVGAKPSDILIQFLIEAIFLSILGGIIGIIIGYFGSLILNNFIKTYVTWWSIALSFGFATLVGVVFGVWPARKASLLSPIEALRYE